MPKLIVKKSLVPHLTLRSFHQKRNKILIIRRCGGVGDILMHRMIFEDFKKINPEIELHFACPERFHDLVKDHPFIEKVLDSEGVSQNDYVISYDTSSACGRYEMAISPRSDLHRSDIWANHCGVSLQKHDMHIKLDEETIRFGEQSLALIRKDHTQPAVLIAPISAMTTKDLNQKQLVGLVNGLRMRDCFVYATHSKPIPLLEELNVPVLGGLQLKKWMGVINSSDYVVTVDSAAFHMAGGLGKPTVGIFTFADGKVYGKYYPNFELVQKHRDDGNWPCGPCYNAAICPISSEAIKPCLTEITVGMLMDGVDRMFSKFPWDRKGITRLGVLK